MINKIKEISDKEFIELIKNSTNIKEVLFKLGYTTVGNSWGYSQIKERMLILNLTPYDFKGKSELAKSQNKKVKTEDLFNNKKHPRVVIRRRIIKENLIPYKCAICGITEWNGKTLSLELDHINGINNDNRLENLRFLCPNCHSQTVTYGARNKQTTESKYELSDELKDKISSEYILLKSKKKVADKLGIALKAVTQALSELGMGKHNQKYVIQYNSEHKEIKRFGCIAECCKYLMDNNFVKTKLLKTCRATLNRNLNTLWKGYYFELLDE